MSTIIQFFAVNGATIVFAVAVALLIAAIWTWSRHRLVTACLSLVGAVLLSGVWYLGFSEARVTDLAAQLRAERALTSELKDDVEVAKARTDDAVDDLNAALKVHANQLARLHVQAERLSSSLGSEARLEPVSDIDWSATAKVSRDSNAKRYTATRRRIESLDAQIDALNQRLVTAMSSVRNVAKIEPEPKNLKPEIRALRKSLAYGLKTDDYEVEVLPDNEVVRGQTGKYYVIDLKDAQSGLKFRFPGGKYTLSRSDASFRKALNRFVGDVAGKLEKNVRYGFFVRGSADSVPFRGRQLEDYRYDEVDYLQAVGDGRYKLGTRTRAVRASIKNTDLPFLRARFLKDVVATTYPVTKPVILEGTITDRKNNEDRNVELILYVDW